eukprot:746143-Hanusia_phi.AAC.2
MGRREDREEGEGRYGEGRSLGIRLGIDFIAPLTGRLHEVLVESSFKKLTLSLVDEAERKQNVHPRARNVRASPTDLNRLIAGEGCGPHVQGVIRREEENVLQAKDNQ